MRAKHAALVEALTGRFDDHHAELARMLLDQIDALTAQIGTLTSRIEELIAAIPAAQGVDADGTTGPGAGQGQDAPVLPAIARLDEIPGIGRHAAQVHHRRDRPGYEQVPHPRAPGVVGEAVARGPSSPGPGTARAGPARATPISGASSARPPPRRQDRHLPRRTLPAASSGAAASSRPSSPSPAPSWSSSGTCSPTRTARFHELGAGYYASRTDKDRKTRNHIRQLEALGFTVTLAPAA